MSAIGDDKLAPRDRAALRPPPNAERIPLEVPRMEPPPSSLAALLHGRHRSQGSMRRTVVWLLLLLVATATLTAYVIR